MKTSRRTFLAALLGATFTASYSVFIERQLVQVNHYRIKVPKLPEPFIGFKLAHLTDIHLGSLVSDNFVATVIDRTNKLGADAIVCTGDYVHARNSVDEINRVWPLLSRLKAKEGVFSVLGNHDHWADTERSLYWLEQSGQNIRHKARAIVRGNSRIFIGGSGDYWEDKSGIDTAFANLGEDECKILLAHNPDTIDKEFSTRISLFICGHTHGGQVSLPFYGPPILPVQNKLYSQGIIQSNKGVVFISKGIGWTIVPVRFNCYPEIAVLELS